MKINYNVSAMIANAALKRSDNMLSGSLEKLSSGYKINHAKDNASGLAMAKRMNAQIRSLDTANQNSNDGVSVIEIAEGALAEIHEMIQRMSELSIKAGTETMSDDDRKSIDNEIKQLKDEITRVAETTMYNGGVLLDGTYDLKGYTNMPDKVKVLTYDTKFPSGLYKLDLADLDNPTISDINDHPLGNLEKIECEDGICTATLTDGSQLKCSYDPNDHPAAVEIDVTEIGAMHVQVGTNEGQTLDIKIPTISLSFLGIDKYDCSTYDNAQDFIAKIKDALAYVSSARSSLGAYENRLEHTIRSLDISEENMTAAYSRIMDTDMAKEMSEYSKNQVLVQAGTSMLTQANERPSQVLQLLQ